MAEKRIGLIPYARTSARNSNENVEDCCILVTDRRTILAFTKPRTSVRQGFKELFGKEANAQVMKPMAVDMVKVDIDSLAAMNDNLSIPHLSIEKFSLGRMMGSHALFMEYRNQDQKKQFLLATIAPPRELIERRKREGIKPKEAKRQYVAKSQEVFRKALPPLIAQEAEWKL
jgi:hypothetical protein